MAFLEPPTPAPGTPESAQPVPVSIKDNKALVVPKDYVFPAICVVTGRTDDLVPLKRTLTWHPPLVYLTILLNLIIYVIVAMVTRKVSRHTIYLTREVKARRVRWIIISWLLFLGAFVFMGVGIGVDQSEWIVGLPVLLILSLAAYMTRVRTIYAARISDAEAEIRGIPLPVMQQIVAGL